MTFIERLILLVVLGGLGYLIYERFVNGNNPLEDLKDGTKKVFSRDKLK